MQIDRRYSIRPEYCGHAKPRLVVRFCGDWISSAKSRREARDIALDHNGRRLQSSLKH